MYLPKGFRLNIIMCTVCCIVLFTAGCNGNWLIKPSPVVSQPSADAKREYRQAIATYKSGQYSEAAKQFDALREQATDKRFALMALYGAACSRLMAARTPREYNDAMILWDRWVDHVPDTCDYENSTLFDPLIREKMIFSNIPLTPQAPSEAKADDGVPRWLLMKSREELDRLKNELDTTQQAAEKREKKIQELEKEIAELKGQIKALETIDQKIQKKKNAIPTTDSPSNNELK